MDLHRRRRPPALPHQRATDAVRESPEFSDRYLGRNPGAYEIESKIGVWYDVVSTLVNRVRFDWYSPWTGDRGGPPPLPGTDPRGREGYLSVEMLSLAVIGYPDARYDEFDEMMNSSSKGQWLTNSRLWHGDYDEIRPAQRKVTAAMRGARDPRAGKLTYRKHPKPPKYSKPGDVLGKY